MKNLQSANKCGTRVYHKEPDLTIQTYHTLLHCVHSSLTIFGQFMVLYRAPTLVATVPDMRAGALPGT
jgi:hypothetical protein